MNEKVTILLLEDNCNDAELLRENLSGEFDIDLKQVWTERDFRSAISEWKPDVIISDYSLPGFDGKGALLIAQAISPDTPFIFYSGTIGEEAAIDVLRFGATDYVLKERPKRLVTAIRRALEDRKQQVRQREADEQIHAQAQLLDLATDAIVVRDLEDRIRYWNKGAERMYGYTRAEILGKKTTELFPPAFAVMFREAKRITLAKGRWEGEVEHTTKEGKPITVMARWTLMNNDRGEPERILSINTDITEKKQLEKKFLRAQRLESVGTLASGIAHDLNNILSPILMASEVLGEGQLDKHTSEMVEMIRNSAQRGAEVVKQLLMFVRGGDGERSSLNLGALIEDHFKICKKSLGKDIEVCCEIDPDLAPVKADATQMHQVLMNLCVNARDAMPQGGKLKVTAKNCEHSHIVFELVDTGSGIPADIQDKIFDPFFTTKEPGKGTGLGLSTVLGIVNSHGGKLALESEEGSGTVIRIFLPVDPDAQTGRARAEVDEAPRGQGEVILVADDELEVRKLLGHMLTENGYQVLSAHDGGSALVQFTRNQAQIRAVITDVAMPSVGGASLAKSLRVLKPSLRIIGISGTRQKGEIPDADEFLLKPFASEDLLRVLDRLLRPAARSAV